MVVDDYPSDQSIHQLFEAQVARTPLRAALISGQQRITYQELNRQANRLAAYLCRSGVGREALIGICMQRSIEMVIGLLGILKANAAYVPLDPAYPRERLAFMLDDARPAILLTQQHLAARLPSHERTICLDRDWQAIAQESEENVSGGVGGDHIAYMLYTSGSTGVPKGVLGTHRAAINRFCWMWNAYPFEQHEVCCQKTSLSFVDSVWEIFGPLLQGIPVVIIPDPLVKDSRQLLQTLAAHAVTRIVLVPSLLRVLLESENLQNSLPCLKYWTSSGETLSVDLAQRFLRQMPNSILLNLYGSSEVAADVTFYDVRNYTSQTSIPIGRPIANTQIYLLDEQMLPVPSGAPGELYAGGDGLARGYFNRPELTASRFVPDPFTGKPGARLYRTGDIARYLDDGNIEYLGRLDHQVKLRGVRVELGEIESVLGQHPAIRQVVVVAREDAPSDKRLLAYVVSHEKQSASPDELQKHMLERLPDYMVPSAFVFLEQLPLTPNGKLDRQALPVPVLARPALSSDFLAARTPIEEAIAAIWSQALGIEQIGVHDNFFELGGHSLLAMQILSRLQADFSIELPVHRFLEAPTVAQLAEMLQQGQNNGSTSHKPSLRSISREAYRMPSS
ncbi:MAG TPA: non-ribosomal peptide synthetase [Ktedonobacteraceae bacterium]|jgi:amino acid adenylation domain-containing protein|nr:non-ribosomal peptide synthetase [Ktedonobacteraceae bacterium]